MLHHDKPLRKQVAVVRIGLEERFERLRASSRRTATEVRNENEVLKADRDALRAIIMMTCGTASPPRRKGV